ncbi:MAG: PPOX class F420-dependent oxidoreductase [Nitrososphaerales archaeon]|jgi:pyridoxamine 5'-phosphate oxidase family protein
MLSGPEIEYLKAQRLARLASVSPKGQPEVSPVGFEWDGKYLYVGTHSQGFFPMTQRVKNITRGNARVSLVVDDLVSVDPWKVRGIKFLGTAEIVEREGRFGKGKYIRITPRVSVSWGIEPEEQGKWNSKKVHA